MWLMTMVDWLWPVGVHMYVAIHERENRDNNKQNNRL